jgi:hypothetical protein
MTADVRFSGRNWGRWGEDDERGALNLVTPQRVLEAARQVKRGSVYELGRPIDHRMPVPQSRSVPVHSMTRDATARGRRANFADDTILLATHTGAHIDALAHVWYDGMLYNGFSDQSVATDGVRRCGIEKIGPLVGRGVLADIRGGSSKGLAPEERITRQFAKVTLSWCGPGGGPLMNPEQLTLTASPGSTLAQHGGSPNVTSLPSGLTTSRWRYCRQVGPAHSRSTSSYCVIAASQSSKDSPSTTSPQLGCTSSFSSAHRSQSSGEQRVR